MGKMMIARVFEVWINNRYGRQLAIVRTYDPDYWQNLAADCGYFCRVEMIEPVPAA